ncbi:MAG: oligosaccharide flippase family protein [Actinomycetota bacterium]|nr:oligosaccharide flippase family protein [Actinomycetota bacterium]
MTAAVRTQLKSGIFGRGAMSYLVAFAGISVASFVFHLVVSRLLGPTHYGVMGALLGIISLLTVPLGAVQIAVTQAVVDKEVAGQSFSMVRVTWRSFLAGCVAMVVLAGFAPLIDAFLHIGSPLPIFLVAAWIPLATVSAVLQGSLIGEYRFRPVAFASFVGIGLIRLILGDVMVSAGFGVSGAVAATIFAQAFTMLSLLFSARHEFLGHRHASVVRTKMRDTVLSVAALAGYTTLIGVDTFLAQHFFSSSQAGKYAAVAVAAHIAFFIPAALVTVAFPHLADGKGTNESSRRIFRQTLRVSVALGVLAAAVMTVLPALTIRILFGAKYAGAASILGQLSFASVAVGLLILFVYLHLARRSVMALTPWIGVVLAVVLISLFHHSSESVALIMLIVSLVTMVVAGVPALRWRIEHDELVP